MFEPKLFSFHSASFTGLNAGVRLIVLGAVHGNETCGTQAIQRVMTEIHNGEIQITAGHVTLVPITNPLAYARQQRMGDRNLNRNLYPKTPPVDYEDHIANWLCPLLAQHEVLLDLHSFHTPGEPFVMLGPENNTGTLEPFALAGREEALALRLGVRRVVDGWLDTYAAGVLRRAALIASESNTRGQVLAGERTPQADTDPRYGVGTTEYMRSVGGCALTLECGQHADPAAPEVAYRAILNTLATLGLIAQPAHLPIANPEALRLYQVIDKAHREDAFSRKWSSFDRVANGELIGVRQDGAQVVAGCEGFIVFPNPQAQPGQEWFYLARRSGRV
jgi:predicted deacylase